ncbi:unnamed protein product, partial [Ectocarpus sp. 8 AP-2014]
MHDYPEKKSMREIHARHSHIRNFSELHRYCCLFERTLTPAGLKHVRAVVIIAGVAQTALSSTGKEKERSRRMSVRDKIAGFGGPASTGIGGGGGGRPNGGFGSTARIGTNVPTSSSNARASPASSSSLGGDPDSVSKLKVPDVFRNATKPADIPLAAAMQVAPSAAPKKWATPAGSVKLGVSNGGGLGASRAGSAPAGAPGWKARNGGAYAAPDTTAKRPVSDAAKKPRDVLGLTSAGSAPSLVRPAPAAVESRPTATGSSGGSGGGGRAESGRASPP